MAISIFPSTAAEFVSNNFVVDMNDTTNNTVTLENIKQAGTYNISVESGDTSFDIYLLDSDGALVSYTNTTTVAATGLFQTVVILGVATSEKISFSYAGTVNNTDGEGNQTGAGAYIENATPSDLPTIDDTTTVTGGNFATDVQVKFDSGATSLDAKNLVRNSETELIVTRPDALDANLDPWSLRVINPGIAEPTGSNANLFTITAGATPTWVTTSPLPDGSIGTPYNETLEATDPDGGAVTYAVTSGSLPAGLSLNSTTGVLSGTPTAGGSTFTVTATDDGDSSTSREFELFIPVATGGTITTAGGFTYHTFTSTDDFEVFVDIPGAEYIIIAGGGGGNDLDGGGGAGGLLNGTQTITAGTHTATIGAGGAENIQGNNSTLATVGTALGGGRGAQFDQPGNDGGSGSGTGRTTDGVFRAGGSGTAGQGNDGGSNDSPSSTGYAAGGGGGAGQAGFNGGDTSPDGNGGNGLQFSDWASATSTGADGGYYAGGGAGGSFQGPFTTNGLGNGSANTGGGGSGTSSPTINGQSGLIMVRYS